MPAGQDMLARAAAGDGRELRRLIGDAPGLAVLTGGQTGVDTEAAVAALRAGLTVHLAFPRGWHQEDGPVTPARRQQLRGAAFHQLGSAGFTHRTWTAVAAADAVVLLDPAGGDGCRQTALAAAHFGRPLLAPGPGPLSPPDVAGWLAGRGARILLIAGCRASLLAGRAAAGDWPAQIASVAAGARLRHDALIGSASGVRDSGLQVSIRGDAVRREGMTGGDAELPA